MSIYAQIQSGTVSQLFTPPDGFTIDECFHPDLTWVDVTEVSPSPQTGWTYDDGVFAPPPPPPSPSISQQAAALLASGLTITSASIAGLNGTYDCGDTSVSHIQAELLSTMVRQTFADGTTTVDWPDTAGALHTFPSVQSFQPFAIAVGAFVAACLKVLNGASATLPSTTVDIP